MPASPDVVAREIEGDIVIVPLVSGIGDADDELYTLNQTGHALLEEARWRAHARRGRRRAAEEFDAPRATIEADVVGFAAEMVRRGILAVRE